MAADSTAIHTCATKLYYSNENSAAFVQIGEVTEIDIPGDQISSVDKTHLDITDCYRQFMPGLGDGNEITFTVNLQQTGSNYALLRTLLRGVYDWKVELPNADLWEATAFITNLGMALPEDDRITCPVTLKVTGKPTYTQD